MKVGLMLPLGEAENRGRPLFFDELKAMAVAAEESGLDSVWGADHVIHQDDGVTRGIHECWTILSAVAAVTRRVEIGPLVLAVPFRNPALIAKMATTLDEVSGGRLILGLGCGWHEPEFDAFGWPFDHRVGRFEDALRIIAPLLRGETVHHDGKWHRADGAVVLPAGPRQDGPPILIAGKRPRMLRLVARHASAWNSAWYGDPSEADVLRTRIRDLREACAAEGRDPASIALTAGIHVSFPHLPGAEEPPPNAISGSPEQVASALAGYRSLGIEHLIAHIWPRSAAAVMELGRAAALAREELLSRA